MSVLRNRRVQIVLALLVLLLMPAAWLIGVNVWAGRQYDAASQALESYDYAQASGRLQSYLSIHPTDAEVLLLAGQTARRREDFPEAKRLLALAEQNGASADALAIERELLRTQQGDLADAGALTRLCKEHPDDAVGALALEALIGGGLRTMNLSLARWAVDLWLSHRPGKADQVQGLMWRGQLDEFAQDFAQALTDFRQAVDLAPDDPRARLRLAESLIREEPRQAVPHMEWLRRVRPDDLEVRFQSARLRRALGKPEEAAPMLDEVLGVAPDMVPALVERGRTALDMDQPAEAERWLRRALELAPGLREVNLALSDCLRREGRPDEAGRYQQNVKEIDARLQKALDDMIHNGDAGRKE